MVFLLLAKLALKGGSSGETHFYKIQTEKSIYDNWFEFLASKEIEFPRVVLAQIILETSNPVSGLPLDSKVFLENKNYFGMKFRPKRFATGEKNGHAAYADKHDSFKAYSKYQKMILGLARKKYRVETEDDYLYVLDNLPHCDNCRYAEDPLYTTKLRKIMKTFQD